MEKGEKYGFMLPRGQYDQPVQVHKWKRLTVLWKKAVRQARESVSEQSEAKKEEL